MYVGRLAFTQSIFVVYFAGSGVGMPGQVIGIDRKMHRIQSHVKVMLGIRVNYRVNRLQRGISMG